MNRPERNYLSFFFKWMVDTGYGALKWLDNLNA
jgi:hypothetical protein